MSEIMPQGMKNVVSVIFQNLALAHFAQNGDQFSAFHVYGSRLR